MRNCIKHPLAFLLLMLIGSLLLTASCGKKEQGVEMQISSPPSSPEEVRKEPASKKDDDDVDSVKEAFEKTGDGFEKAGKEMEKGFKKTGSEIKDFFVGDDDKK